ncbi:hypothetical protein [Shinella sp. M31]|uniref:hypothetical protein n=1 Tax=Shinella sp. M31 TaxID=3368615 RepID=UPI003BA06309
MKKSIKLAINAFPSVPAKLQRHDDATKSVTELSVDLADLYLHHFFDKWERIPPNPDPVHFDHVRYLMPTPDFRFQRNGLGASTTSRGNTSNELGHAFCRWFLAEKLDITYIAHLEHVRDHGTLASRGGVSVQTDNTTKGDAPDYFCADGGGAVSLAEAKGTSRAVGFKSADFKRWRNQFKRVKVLDVAGKPLRVKGYIVATRWATEQNSPAVYTKLSAEDPETVGDPEFRDEDGRVAVAVKAVHYGSTFLKLGQPLIAAALISGFLLPSDLKFEFAVWECLHPALASVKFVGGYFPTDTRAAQPYFDFGRKPVISPPNLLRLDVSGGTFFGVEEQTARSLIKAAKTDFINLTGLRPLDQWQGEVSGMSFLRDGHIIGPVNIFRPVAIISV